MHASSTKRKTEAMVRVDCRGVVHRTIAVVPMFGSGGAQGLGARVFAILECDDGKIVDESSVVESDDGKDFNGATVVDADTPLSCLRCLQEDPCVRSSG